MPVHISNGRLPQAKTHPQKQWIRTIAPLFYLLTVPGPTALAADPLNNDTRADVRDNRDGLGDRIGGENRLSRDLEPKKFTLTLKAPATYTDNANADATNVSSLHFTPEIRLQWDHKLSDLPFALLARVNAVTDRYTALPDPDNSAAYARFELTYKSDNRGQTLFPFIGYQPRSLYDPSTGKWSSATHDIYAGVENYFTDDFSVTLWAGRREVRDRSSNYVKFDAYLSKEIGSGWTVDFETIILMRRFDKRASFVRRDLSVNPILAFVYKLNDNVRLQLDASFYRHFSNKGTAEYDQWDVGPTAKMVLKF